jgi:phosphatidylglycerophosphate synthase
VRDLLDHISPLEAAAEPARRTFEIEDPTNLYFIHPLSARLVPVFARLGITPNTVSMLGMACGFLAGLFYHFYSDTACALAGFALMLGWHIMDGADGQLARLTRTYSELGKVLDGICDYVTFTAVYVGLALAMTASLGGWVLALVPLAGLCHAIQSAAYELQRQEYNVLGWGKQSAALPKRTKLPSGLPWRERAAARLHQLYAGLQIKISGGTLVVHSRFVDVLAAHPTRQAALREAYRAHFAPVIRRWCVLSSNYRTLGILIAVLLKLPALYFLFEIFGFSLILLILLQAQKAQNAAFLQRLEQTQGRRQPFMPAVQQPGAQPQQHH